MAYKVLYRKYRPKNFNELYGQDSIKKLLIDAIINDKISHAYLFSGPRGTGKTSTAKLFSKTINCMNCQNGIPCEKCESCLNYDNSPDIIEIDAASNNGVEEIRNLRENAKILPTNNKYKIYIIDEVHMLSQSAWNAFLKLLEEPPKHIIFILATTEIQKVPITILSRCQRFNFKKIDNKIIIDNIINISQKEKIQIDQEAASLIAQLADGGMRDALSLLDQLSKENTKITNKLIQDTFGIISNNEIESLFELIKQKNIDQINNILDNQQVKGIDTNLLISQIINYLFHIENNIINNKESYYTINDIKELSQELIKYYNKADAITLIKISLLGLIKNSNINNQNDEISSTDKQIKLKKAEKQKPTQGSNNIEKIIRIRINNSFYQASKEQKEKFKISWQSFINKEIEKNNTELLSIIEEATIQVVSSTNVLFSQKSTSTSLLFNEQLDTLEQEFYKLEKINIKFICIDENQWLQEKSKYIANKNYQYSYISENIDKNNNKVVENATKIFDNNIIEIN